MIRVPEVSINYWAVLVATAVSMVVGYLWYAKFLFGRAWMQLVGLNEESTKKGAGPAMFGMLITAFITAFVLANVVDWAGVTTTGLGVMVGVWIWLGFVATLMISEVLFAKKPVKLFFINSLYHLVVLALNGAILAMWV